MWKKSVKSLSAKMEIWNEGQVWLPEENYSDWELERVKETMSTETFGSFSMKRAEYFSGFWLLPYKDGGQMVYLLN